MTFPSFKRLAAAASLIFVLLILLAVYLVWQADSDYAARLANLRAKGIPTTSQELNDFYQVPGGDVDVTEDWQNLIAAMNPASFSEQAQAKILPYLSDVDPPEPTADWSAFQAAKLFLEQQQPLVEQLRESAYAGGTVRFDVDFRLGFDVLLPQSQQCRDLARLFCLDCQVAFREQDFDRVHRNLVGMTRMALILKKEPTLISQLISAALHAMACEQIVSYVPLCNWNDVQLQELQKAVAVADFREAYRVALAGELVFGQLALDRTAPLGVMMLNSPRSEALAFWEDAFKALDLPWHQMIQEHQKISDRISRPRGLFANLRFSVLQMTAPSLQNTSKSMARAVAKQGCVIVYLGVARQRAADLDSPETLADLQEKFLPKGFDKSWPDPFDGQPLRLVRSGDDIIIYSVGRNEEDEGGLIDSSQNSESGDLGFRFPFEP